MSKNSNSSENKPMVQNNNSGSPIYERQDPIQNLDPGKNLESFKTKNPFLQVGNRKNDEDIIIKTHYSNRNEIINEIHYIKKNDIIDNHLSKEFMESKRPKMIIKDPKELNRQVNYIYDILDKILNSGCIEYSGEAFNYKDFASTPEGEDNKKNLSDILRQFNHINNQNKNINNNKMNLNNKINLNCFEKNTFNSSPINLFENIYNTPGKSMHDYENKNLNLDNHLTDEMNLNKKNINPQNIDLNDVNNLNNNLGINMKTSSDIANSYKMENVNHKDMEKEKINDINNSNKNRCEYNDTNDINKDSEVKIDKNQKLFNGVIVNNINRDKNDNLMVDTKKVNNNLFDVIKEEDSDLLEVPKKGISSLFGFQKEDNSGLFNAQKKEQVNSNLFHDSKKEISGLFGVPKQENSGLFGIQTEEICDNKINKRLENIDLHKNLPKNDSNNNVNPVFDNNRIKLIKSPVNNIKDIKESCLEKNINNSNSEYSKNIIHNNSHNEKDIDNIYKTPKKIDKFNNKVYESEEKIITNNSQNYINIKNKDSNNINNINHSKDSNKEEKINDINCEEKNKFIVETCEKNLDSVKKDQLISENNKDKISQDNKLLNNSYISDNITENKKENIVNNKNDINNKFTSNIQNNSKIKLSENAESNSIENRNFLGKYEFTTSEKIPFKKLNPKSSDEKRENPPINNNVNYYTEENKDNNNENIVTNTLFNNNKISNNYLNREDTTEEKNKQDNFILDNNTKIYTDIKYSNNKKLENSFDKNIFNNNNFNKISLESFDKNTHRESINNTQYISNEEKLNNNKINDITNSYLFQRFAKNFNCTDMNKIQTLLNEIFYFMKETTGSKLNYCFKSNNDKGLKNLFSKLLESYNNILRFFIYTKKILDDNNYIFYILISFFTENSLSMLQVGEYEPILVNKSLEEILDFIFNNGKIIIGYSNDIEFQIEDLIKFFRYAPKNEIINQEIEINNNSAFKDSVSNNRSKYYKNKKLKYSDDSSKKKLMKCYKEKNKILELNPKINNKIISDSIYNDTEDNNDLPLNESLNNESIYSDLNMPNLDNNNKDFIKKKETNLDLKFGKTSFKSKYKAGKKFLNNKDVDYKNKNKSMNYEYKAFGSIYSEDDTGEISGIKSPFKYRTIQTKKNFNIKIKKKRNIIDFDEDYDNEMLIKGKKKKLENKKNKYDMVVDSGSNNSNFIDLIPNKDKIIEDDDENSGTIYISNEDEDSGEINKDESCNK